MNNLIRYPGGKNRMSKKIVELLPQHNLYGEPFCGSCAVMLRKGSNPYEVKNNDKYIEVINDTNSKLIRMYRYLKTNPNEFLDEIGKILYSRDEFHKAQDILRNSEVHSDRDVAVAMYVVHNQSFAGGGEGSGWGFSKEKNGGTIWNNRKGKLEKLCRRFSKCTIDNIDALEFIRRYDKSGALFYCDPPYPETYQEMYVDRFGVDDFQNLIDLAETSKASFAISSYGGGSYSHPDWVKHEFDSTMTSARDKSLNKKRTEVLMVLER